MYKSMVAAAAVSLTALVGPPAIAADVVYGPPPGPAYAAPIYRGPVSAAEAQDIAAANGVIGIRKLDLDEGVWKIKGRDTRGARVEMKIDQSNGAIVELERFY